MMEGKDLTEAIKLAKTLLEECISTLSSLNSQKANLDNMRDETLKRIGKFQKSIEILEGL